MTDGREKLLQNSALRPNASTMPRDMPQSVGTVLEERFLFDSDQTAEIYAAVRRALIAEHSRLRVVK
ncbi:MAG: hypothetical protein AAF577_05435 [Pseudomonadota bacterium]